MYNQWIIVSYLIIIKLYNIRNQIILKKKKFLYDFK
jgi:hypothetical protein